MPVSYRCFTPPPLQQRFVETVLGISRKTTVAQVGETVLSRCFARCRMQNMLALATALVKNRVHLLFYINYIYIVVLHVQRRPANHMSVIVRRVRTTTLRKLSSQ